MGENLTPAPALNSQFLAQKAQKMKLNKTTGLIIGLALTSSTQAAIMLVDFGRSDTITTGNWNNVHGPSGSTLSTPTVDLIDDGGAPTVYDLNTSFADGGSWAGSGADYAGAKPAPFTSAPGTAVNDSLFVQTTSFVTITLTNLSSLELYDLVFYGARGNNGGASAFTITDGTGTLPQQSFDVFNNAAAVATFSGLVADGSGVITIVFQGLANANPGDGTGSQGALNALQITSSVPEPSSMVLFGSCGLLALMRRRR